MAFGPDGYLYLTVGDEGSGADALDNSQKIDRNFFSGMLRIDVDMRSGNLPPNPHPAVVGNYLVRVGGNGEGVEDGGIQRTP